MPKNLKDRVVGYWNDLVAGIMIEEELRTDREFFPKRLVSAIDRNTESIERLLKYQINKDNYLHKRKYGEKGPYTYTKKGNKNAKE